MLRSWGFICSTIGNHRRIIAKEVRSSKLCFQEYCWTKEGGGSACGQAGGRDQVGGPRDLPGGSDESGLGEQLCEGRLEMFPMDTHGKLVPFSEEGEGRGGGAVRDAPGGLSTSGSGLRVQTHHWSWGLRAGSWNPSRRLEL